MIGDTHISKFKGNRSAAYSISGDDSLHSQLDFMIPEMLKRGFKGTIWINPGRGTVGEKGFCWRSRESEWIAAARNGFDFANHTIYHRGARNYEDAEYEISESARIIWAANPRQRLQLFLGGGGTTWDVPREEVDALLRRYDCVRGRGGGISVPVWHQSTDKSATAEEILHYVDKGLEEGNWHLAACHGVGPNAEWLPTDEEPFLALLDALYAKRDLIWVDTNTNIHKYVTERDAAVLNITEAGEKRITLTLTAPLNPVLYDYPLTLQTETPKNWKALTVTQGRTTQSVSVSDGLAQYEALPDGGSIQLTEKII